MNRIDETFARLRQQGRMGLFPYLMAGFPTLDATEQLAIACAAAGADGFELGVPFSDPLADGATIQRAGEVALRNGASLTWTLELADRLRRQLDLPLVLMTYYNPVHHYGVARLANDARDAGIDGFIVPDLPWGEASALLKAAHDNGLHVTPLVAPTTPDARLDEVGHTAGGFVYCVSLLGTTGGRAAVSTQLPAFMGRVRAHIARPLVIGFGIVTPEHVTAVRPYGDAVIMGSAIVDLLARTPLAEGPSALGIYVSGLRAACDGAVRDATVTSA